MQELLQAKYMGISIPDISSLAGLAVTIIGFIITIYNVIRSKSASESAKLAAEEATRQINLLETIQDFSTLLSILEAIKSDVRKKNFEPLPEKLSNIRKSLIGIRGKHTGLSDQEQSIIQNAITQFRIIEKKIDNDLDQNQKINIGSINHLFSVHIDELHEVLSKIRNGEQA